MLEGHVRRQECDQGCLGVQTEGVVVEVDGVEVREVEDRGKEERKRFGDLVEEATGEDVGEVGNLGGKRCQLSVPTCNAQWRGHRA